MRNIIIGTAGHIDHGKTSMVKALTGVDTDTLKEEQARGITVNLGFTYITLDEDLKIGLIDVPGHEKLIKNMLAGVYGMDLILLTIAVNDGIMPQTLEHMEIIKFLNVKNIIVVLTKTDLATDEQIEAVKHDVKKTFDLNTFVKFSIYQEDTVEDLKQAIADNIQASDETIEENFRMPIDRVFNVKGQGVVVTGSSLSGSVKIGDRLEVLPDKTPVRVKGIQAFNQPRTEAYKHMRVALNLAGVKKQDLNRGSVLATKDTLLKSNIIDVKITVSNHLDDPIKHLERVKLYYLASEFSCRIKCLNRKRLSEGETVYGQLLFDTPIYASKKDLGILRRINPNKTVAGIEIINVSGAYVNRKDESYEALLNLHEVEDKPKLIETFIENHPFVKANELKQKLDLGTQDVHAFFNAEGVLLDEQSCLTKKLLKAYQTKLVDIVSTYHQNHPHDIGMNKRTALQSLDIDISIRTFNAFLNHIKTIKTIEDKIALTSFKLRYNQEEEKIIKRIIESLESSGFSPKKPREIITMLHSKKAETLFYALVKEGRIIKITSDIMITENTYKALIAHLETFFSKHNVLEIKDARDLLNTSRKYVVAYLEYLDKVGFTRRTESGRIKK